MKPNWRAIRVGGTILAFLVWVTWISPVSAAELDLQWQFSANDCSGDPAAAVTDLEIYVSTTPIPASNVNCPPDGDPVDAPPPGGQVDQILTPDPGDTGIRITVADGDTYYIRARVRDARGRWSNLSHPERVFDAPFPDPAAPTITVIRI